jgi:glycosyltransferase involved in cell wall biosynthesis
MLQHDIVSLHLPQAEGGALSLIANKFAHKPVVLTYHCDLQLPPGILNRAIDKMVYGTNIWARAFADKIVTYTDDFARNSPFLSRALDKVIVIPPPVEMPPPSAAQVAAMREKYHVNGHQIVGFAARLAEEKGVDYLIKSIPLVRERLPEVKYLLAGPRDNVIGENVWERLQPLVKKYQDSLEFVGEIPNREMGNFFAVCDVLTVPSVNSTESFGLVQIEAMLSGTPVVASNLPGVREPVRMTGMGEIVPLRDEHALADKIVQVIQDKPRYLRPRKEIENMFALDRTVQAYESLFEGLIRAKKK